MEIQLVDVRNDEGFVRVIWVEIRVDERLEVEEFPDYFFSWILTLRNDNSKISKEECLILNLTFVITQDIGEDNSIASVNLFLHGDREKAFVKIVEEIFRHIRVV